MPSEGKSATRRGVAGKIRRQAVVTGCKKLPRNGLRERHVRTPIDASGGRRGDAPSPRSFAASLEASLERWSKSGGTSGRRRDRDPVAGVVARYGLHRPLIWSDELASILFLCWRAGCRGRVPSSEHMRMTAIVANAKPAMRPISISSPPAPRGFLLCRLAGPYEYATKKVHHTPALQSPNLARGGVGVGIA